jgi:hypothetical protein
MGQSARPMRPIDTPGLSFEIHFRERTLDPPRQPYTVFLDLAVMTVWFLPFAISRTAPNE